MTRTFKLALVAALPLLGAHGCSDFLTAEEAQEDPNRQTIASMNQRFIGVQATQWLAQSGEDARLFGLWTQQMMGTQRQYQSLALYDFGEGEVGFGSIYAGGGLVDLRAIQARATELGDELYLGIAQVMEALVVGTAASIFGDIPYSEAVSDVETPVLDPQLAVYDALQALLDEAIANIAAGGTGPVGADLVYGGDADKWTELAYTLKARFYMHTAEVRGAAAYEAALDAVPSGISTTANDYVAPFDAVPGQENPWYQFMVVQREGYMTASEFTIELLKGRADPRLSEYFQRGDTTEFVGAAPGESDQAWTATLNMSSDDSRGGAGFDQPIVTHAENVLIWAEAAYMTGDEPTALLKLNEARALDGLDPVALAGTALITEIMTEKYIQLFQNIEVWNDWKRTCVPNIPPAVAGMDIPSRVYYPTSERQTNPNVPDVADQPARNANDSPGGTVNDAAACLGA